MASQPPTGYNPEASLLQGGTAPIVPVQGGGGMDAGASLPAGYNPDQSLLNTGVSAPIVAVRGGSQEGGQPETAYHELDIEHYDPPLISIPLPKEQDSDGRKSMIQAYTLASKPFLKELKSFIIDPTDYKSTGSDNAMYRFCPTPSGRSKLPLNFFQGARKHVVIIDKPDIHIWIIPNIQGNLSKFLQYMKLIPKEARGNIQPNHYVILTGTFFSGNVNTDVHFYHEFLLQKYANMENIYSVITLSEEFVRQSCSLMNNTYSLAYLTREQNHLIPTFFETDFIVFKQQHIVFKNSELPLQRNDMAVSIGSVLEKPDAGTKYKSFVIVPAIGVNEEFNPNSGDAPPEKKYFLFDYNVNNPKKITLPTKSVILCPKGQTCSNFKGGYELEKLPDDKRLDIAGLFHIYKNTDKMPFLKDVGSSLSKNELNSLSGVPPPPPPPPIKELEVEEKKEEKEEVKEEVKEESEEQKKLKALLSQSQELKFKEKKKKIPFEADASAVKAKEEEFEINAKIFKLRNPLEKGVRDNWKLAKFSENEVDFLNSMQFTPELLIDTFGTRFWKLKLAEFLENLLLSNCFQDTTLLTKLECSNAQQFVKMVYFTMYNQMLTEIYDEMGVVKPKTIGDLIFGMKQLGQFAPLEGTYEISKYDYTGDLLERFQVIHYNKKKGVYYTDFADLKDATREILQKMKLHRISDTNIEEITKAILERMKIPVPPVKPMPGGFVEELVGEELLDLGEVLEEGIEESIDNLNEAKPNKNYRKHTLRKKNNKKNSSRKHSHKRK